MHQQRLRGDAAEKPLRAAAIGQVEITHVLDLAGNRAHSEGFVNAGNACPAMPAARSATSLRWMLSSDPAPMRMTLYSDPEAASTRFMPLVDGHGHHHQQHHRALPPMVCSSLDLERNRFRTA
jgi:hypothetical protein